MIVLSMVFLALYAPTVGFGFVFDDIREVENNEALRGPVLAGLTMSQHDHQGTQASPYRIPVHDSFRPLRYLSYQFDSKVFGLSPAAMHLHNVALGLGVIWVLWWLLSLLRVDPRGALGIAAIFALHPVQVESVAYISARSDLHAGLFALLTCCFLFRFLEKPKISWLMGAALCFFLCMASKESYLLLPGTVAIAAWHRGVFKQLRTGLALLLSVAVVWLFIRSSFVDSSGQSHLIRGLAQSGALLRDYFTAFVWPFDSTVLRRVDWGIPWLETLLLAGASLLLARWWIKSRSNAAARTSLSLAWFVLLIGPSLLATTIFETCSDRYLYLPVVGLIALGAQGWALAWSGKKVFGPVVNLVGGCLVVSWVLWTTQLIPSWRSQTILAKHAVEISPDVGRAWVWWGDIQAKEGGCDSALPSYRRALTVDPQYAPGWNNVSVCLLREGSYSQALDHAEQAIKLDPAYAKARANAGIAAEALGQKKKACQLFRSATQLTPGYMQAQDGVQRTCPSD